MLHIHVRAPVWLQKAVSDEVRDNDSAQAHPQAAYTLALTRSIAPSAEGGEVIAGPVIDPL
jgi:hypothetical protein